MITIAVDLTGVTAYLTELQQKQIPFATAKGLNAVALDVQTAERARLRDVFALRRPEWADRSIKITHFAKKAEPWATIAIAHPGGRVDLLGKFETDTEKKALSSSHGIAVPIEVKRSKKDIIGNANKPSAFNLRRQGGRVVGDRGTHIVRLSGGRELLLQRKTLGKRAAKSAGRSSSSSSIVLYLFTPKVTIKPDLHFVPTATKVISRMWEQRMGDALAAALATAR